MVDGASYHNMQCIGHNYIVYSVYWDYWTTGPNKKEETRSSKNKRPVGTGLLSIQVPIIRFAERELKIESLFGIIHHFPFQERITQISKKLFLLFFYVAKN